MELPVHLDDGVHGAADEPLELLLPVAEVLLEPLAAHLGDGPAGEELEEGEEPLLGRHGPDVHHGEVADEPLAGAEERDPEVADDAGRAEVEVVVRVEVEDPVRDVDEPPLPQGGLAGGASDRVLEGLDEPVPEPEGERPQPRAVRARLGEPGAEGVEGAGEAPHQRAVEGLAGLAGRPLDDGPQRGLLVDAPLARHLHSRHPCLHHARHLADALST